MKQISYNIFLELIKSNNHIRGLAKALNTNPMTISRTLKELEKNNIVEFNQEGKNKAYRIKDSLDAREYSKIIEHHKLTDIILRNPEIRTITKTIQDDKDIRLAILFGSYSKNTEKKESDIDIYVETTIKDIKERVELLDSKVSVKTGEFDKENLLIKEIIKSHIIIKGVDRYHELVHQTADQGRKNKADRT
jgi:predicted nucleotidyltransferase